MELHTIIGSIGVALLLLAYILLQIKKLNSQQLSYAFLNFFGATLAMWSSYLIDFMPFVILEGIWALVALQLVLKIKLNMETKIKNFNPDPTYQIFKPYNLSLSAKADNLLFVTGQIGANDDGTFPEDFETQLRNVFIHLDRILKDAKADWNNVVQLRTFHTGDLEGQFPKILEFKAKYMPHHQHAWTAIGVTQLIPTQSKIEIDMIALVNE